MTGLRSTRIYSIWERGNAVPAYPCGFLSLVLDFKYIAKTLRQCGRTQATADGKSLHSLLLKRGSCWDVFVANNLISMYADFRFFDDAQRMFDEMPDKNVVSWTTAVSANVRARNPNEALIIFTQMLDYEMEVPNSYTMSAALKACGMASNLELGKRIHMQVLSKLRPDDALMNAVMDMYVKCGNLSEAQKVFDGLAIANSTSWNTMLAGYTKQAKMEEAENIFCRIPKPDAVSFNTIIAGFAQEESPKALEYMCMMHRDGISLDQFTFPCALKICGRIRSEALGKQIHSYVIKSGFELGCYTGSSLIDMYAKCGGLNEATELYNKYSNYAVSASNMLALSNSLLDGYAATGHNGSALDLLSEVHSSGIQLDAYTLSSALKICINLQSLRCGYQVHALLLTSGCHSGPVVGSVLVDFYLQFGNLENALILFHSLPQKDTIAWAGLIAGCIKRKSYQLAFALFRDFMSTNIKADQFVISSVLNSCSSVAGVECGKQVHGCCIKLGFETDSVTVTSLIDMYSKCGEIDDGLTVFRNAIDRDTVCWTGIIMGFANNGRAKDAIEYFQEMLKAGVEPNSITFLGALSACRHCGLVAEASSLFESLQEDYGIIPCLEHYCCMVGILSRAGCIEEALRLIEGMPYKPDGTIWNSLHGACFLNDNVDISKLGPNCQLSALPAETSVYLTLSNVCASLGMWENSTKLRQVARKVGRKEPGRSWIEVRT